MAIPVAFAGRYLDEVHSLSRTYEGLTMYCVHYIYDYTWYSSVWKLKHFRHKELIEYKLICHLPPAVLTRFGIQATKQNNTHTQIK